MTASRHKMFRDLSQEGTRTVLVVFAIAVGIAGFTAVLSAYAILVRELNRGYLDTNPASATLRIDKVDDALLAAVRSNPAIEGADARRIVGGRMQSRPGEWHSLRLFVVQDFGARIAKLQPEHGAWPPATGEILIERDAIGVARVAIGDTVTVQTASGQEHTLRVAGSLHDVGQAQARMENIVYGYITLDTLASLGEAPYLDRLNILVATGKSDRQHIRDVAADIKKLAESTGHNVRSVDVPVPGEHPHARIMGLLLLVMCSFGLAILGISGILVINLVAAMMALQVRQIGVMKATGASTWQVASLYLSQSLLLGTAAILIALPAGIAGGRQLCNAMAQFLNFDMTSYAAPVWVYLLAALAGWAVPLLAAAHPVWKVSRIPPRVALAEFGASTDGFGSSAFDRALAGIGGASRPLLLALRNTFRRRARLAWTLATLVSGGLLFLTGLNVRASLVHTLDRLFATRKFDLSVNLGGMYSVETIQRAIKNTAGIARAEEWTVSEAEHFTVVALPPQSTLLKLDIVQGRGLLPGDSSAMVVNSALAASRKLAVGDTIPVRIGKDQGTWKIVGIALERFSPPVAYVSRGNATPANSIRLSVNQPSSLEPVKTDLFQNLQKEGLRAESSSSHGDSRFSFDQHMLMIYVFLVVVSSMIAMIGGLGLMTTMSLNVLERRQEMGVLRAIGATPGTVWLIVVAEGVAVGLLSWALATLTAWPVSKAIGNYIGSSAFIGGLDFRFDATGVLIWLAVSLFVGVVASLLPAWNASRSTVREALSQ